MSCNDKNKFKTAEASSKAYLRTKGIIDKTLSILDINKFRQKVTLWTSEAKEKYEVDLGRLFLEEKQNTSRELKAVANSEAFRQIDKIKKILKNREKIVYEKKLAKETKQKELKKEYPKTINVNGINLNTDKLLEFSPFNSTTEENAISDEDIKKYGKVAESVHKIDYIPKKIAEWIKNNSEFTNNLQNAYNSDKSEGIIEQDLDFFEYSQYLLDKNVRLIDVNQLNLFDKEETDTPNCIIP